MLQCEGRPNVGCPAKANNSSIKLSKGDLMLCRDCEIFRFPCLAPKSTTMEGCTLPSASSTVTAVDQTHGSQYHSKSADSSAHGKLTVNERWM